MALSISEVGSYYIKVRSHSQGLQYVVTSCTRTVSKVSSMEFFLAFTVSYILNNLKHCIVHRQFDSKGCIYNVCADFASTHTFDAIFRNAW